MIELLISVIVLCIVAGLLYWVVTLLPLPAPFPTIIQVCVILICVIYLIGLITGQVAMPHVRLR